MSKQDAYPLSQRGITVIVVYLKEYINAMRIAEVAKMALHRRVLIVILVLLGSFWI
jgi:hypothetical protein